MIQEETIGDFKRPAHCSNLSRQNTYFVVAAKWFNDSNLNSGRTALYVELLIETVDV